MERERNKVESDLTESRAKAKRLDDRVTNLNSLVTKLETQLADKNQEVEAGDARLDDVLKQHKIEMAEKEKKL